MGLASICAPGRSESRRSTIHTADRADQPAYRVSGERSKIVRLARAGAWQAVAVGGDDQAARAWRGGPGVDARGPARDGHREAGIPASDAEDAHGEIEGRSRVRQDRIVGLERHCTHRVWRCCRRWERERAARRRRTGQRRVEHTGSHRVIRRSRRSTEGARRILSRDHESDRRRSTRSAASRSIWSWQLYRYGNVARVHRTRM